MPVYEFEAPHHEIDCEARFLGFANNATEQYLWFQREECSELEVVPNAGNVWVEVDDQQLGGRGGIVGLELGRTDLHIRFTPHKAEQIGGLDEIRVIHRLTDAQFTAVKAQLLRVFVGYDDIVRVSA